MVIVADDGMLCLANLREIDEAGLRFIVGSMVTKPRSTWPPIRWHGDAFSDGQVIDTLTPKTGHATRERPDAAHRIAWDGGEHPGSWRAVWAYSTKRAVRDSRTLTMQENRAKAVIAGEKATRTRCQATVRREICATSGSLSGQYVRIACRGKVHQTASAVIELTSATNALSSRIRSHRLRARMWINANDLHSRRSMMLSGASLPPRARPVSKILTPQDKFGCVWGNGHNVVRPNEGVAT